MFAPSPMKKGREKMKKTIAIFLSLIMVMGICNVAKAENYYDKVFSTGATAGQWHSEAAQTIGYSSGYTHVCGGDVGVWFYAHSVGLHSSFVNTSARNVYVSLLETDPYSSTYAKDYTGYFSGSGINRPTSWANTYTNGAMIEDDGYVELLIAFLVTTMSADKSTAVDAELLYYRIWVI